jgi:nuclease HARBI1
MPLGRQKDHSAGKVEIRSRRWAIIGREMAKRRANIDSAFASTSAMCAVMTLYTKAKENRNNHIQRSKRLSISDFSFNFNGFSESDSLSLFRFRKDDVLRMMTAIAWPAHRFASKRNRYSVTPLLATCIVLRRLSTPCRWRDLELLFGKHTSQLSEIFWECIENFLSIRENLISGELHRGFLADNASRYAQAVHSKSNGLDNCVGFIDGTVLGIARPGDPDLQRVAYNGHKRKHALKFQVVLTPDGLILHCAGPIEGRRHDWTLYCRSGIDSQLEEKLMVNGIQFCIYGDSGYNLRPYMEVPYQGSNLSEEQKSLNKAMSAIRITVEWIFKEVKQYWSTMDYKRKLRVGEFPVGALYIAAMLLTNLRNCIYPNPTAQYFSCRPPTLEEYLEHKD